MAVQDLRAVARPRLTAARGAPRSRALADALATDPRAQVVGVALAALALGAWGGPLGWVAVALVAGFSVSGSY